MMKASRDPNHDQNWNRQCRDCSDEHDKEENPVPPCLRPRLFFFSDEEAIVSPVRFPDDVEDITHDRHPTHRCFQENVGDHSSESDGSDAATPRSEYDETRSRGSSNIPDPRYPTDESIKPESDSCSGDAPHIVEERGNVVEVFVRLRHGQLTLPHSDPGTTGPLLGHNARFRLD